ncbi:MAG: hypothetical protein GVY10_03135 [Verrucomicrobia bacterium]|nr:hypothetical protein [Verrucomicrobiota bacterium]
MPTTTLDLTGDWTCHRADRPEDKFPARVPGTLHQALLEAGRIPHPFKARNELEVQWVHEHAWVFEREFTLNAEDFAGKSAELVCEGLDTFAQIVINGEPVGQTKNMFRSFRWDVAECLRTGTNRIRVAFDPVMPWIRRKEAERHLFTVNSIEHEPNGRPWVRKEQCNFGWDWGPVLVTCGIWKGIALRCGETCRIGNPLIRQRHRDGSVHLGIHVEISGYEQLPSARATAVLTLEGAEVSAMTLAPAENPGIFHGEVTIANPRLWWPNGMGGQPLYEMTVHVEADGSPLASRSTRIGLRKLRLVQEEDRWGRSFVFEVNGERFFAKGSNWIPGDALRMELADPEYRRLLGDACACHHNMIRIWGGGIYEADAFYDTCDELGLLVWQDFMFACSAYPADDPDFLEEVRAESVDQVCRLRNHPSLALFCGNNELEQMVTREGADWPDMPLPLYRKLFEEMLGDTVSFHAPETPYWPASPRAASGDPADVNRPDSGDAHLWSVWHGRAPFEWYRTSFHRFCSEFGFQSFPEPRTTADFAPGGQRYLNSPVMEHHQRSRNGNTLIMTYLLSWFPMPRDFRASLWMSQMVQAESIKYAVEHWRRNMPRCMGALYWQLNDCWPAASWASIDHTGRWKALHFYSRHFFAPVFVGGVEEPGRATVDLFLVADRKPPAELSLRWILTDSAEGRTLREETLEIAEADSGSTEIRTLELRREYDTFGPENLLLWLELADTDNHILSRNLVTFRKPKALALGVPVLRRDFSAAVDNAGTRIGTLTLQSDRPALYTFIEGLPDSIRPSDNFLHLRPGSPRRIELRSTTGSPVSFDPAEVRIRSLADLVERD